MKFIAFWYENVLDMVCVDFSTGKNSNFIIAIISLQILLITLFIEKTHKLFSTRFKCTKFQCNKSKWLTRAHTNLQKIICCCIICVGKGNSWIYNIYIWTLQCCFNWIRWRQKIFSVIVEKEILVNNWLNSTNVTCLVEQL